MFLIDSIQRSGLEGLEPSEVKVSCAVPGWLSGGKKVIIQEWEYEGTLKGFSNVHAA